MAREISQLLVVSNPKPLVNCLHQGLHIFAGFELYHSNDPPSRSLHTNSR
jgi:hypothetical protein